MSKCHCSYNGCVCSIDRVEKAAVGNSTWYEAEKRVGPQQATRLRDVELATRPQFGQPNPASVKLREAEQAFSSQEHSTSAAIRRGPKFKEGITPRGRK